MERNTMREQDATGAWAGAIRAEVGDGTLDKLAAFWKASLRETVEQIVQNARRAGAGRIRIETGDAEPYGWRIRIEDDGCGCADPAVLLAFGATGWTNGEEGAGVGFHALAATGCEVESHPQGAPGGAGWRTSLEPEHFRGREEAVVEDVGARQGGLAPHGTTVTFRTGEEVHKDRLAEAIRDATRYLPAKLTVTLDGEPVERRSVLDKAARIETTPHGRVGIHRDKYLQGNGVLSFHGVRAWMPAGGPRVVPMDPDRGLAPGPVALHASAEVHQHGGLRVTLPRRDRLVDNDAAADLEATMSRLLHEELAALADERIRDADGRTLRVVPTHAQHEEIRRLGIAMRSPSPLAPRWRAPRPDRTYPALNRCLPLAGLSRPVLRMAATPEKMDAHALEGALERAEAADPNAPLVVPEVPGLRGYAWYDALDWIADVRVRIRQDGREHAWLSAANRSEREMAVDERYDKPAVRPGPVDSISFELLVVDQAGNERTVTVADGTWISTARWPLCHERARDAVHGVPGTGVTAEILGEAVAQAAALAMTDDWCRESADALRAECMAGAHRALGHTRESIQERLETHALEYLTPGIPAGWRATVVLENGVARAVATPTDQAD